jgi:thiamine biosynthesis lipoprotein
MGTVFSFALGRHVDEQTIREVEDELDRLDRTFSTYRPESTICALADGRTTLAACSSEVREVIDRCSQASALTRGYFSAWHSGRLDPTGLVKGWAVERASQLLVAAGCACHVVNGGGDVLARADPTTDSAWRIGISAGSSAEVIASLAAYDVAVATSGNGERPGHIIDPFTGREAVALRSVTVMGPDIVLADAFATAAVAMGEAALDWLRGLRGYDAIVTDAGGSTSMTPGAAAALRQAGQVPLVRT